MAALTTPATPCAVDGETLATFIQCMRTTLGLSDLPSSDDVQGTSLQELFLLPVTFKPRDGYLYYGEIDHAWQFATQPLPSTATRARIVAREDTAP